MRDQPDDVTTTVSCPACYAETVETLRGIGIDENQTYRCLRCGETFDTGGNEPPLSDSDDPHAP